MARLAPSRRILKALGLGVAAVAVLAVAALLTVEVALRSDSVQGAILARVLPMIEESTGVRAEVGDMSLSVLAGSFSADDLSLRTMTGEGLAEPFARIATVRARWSPLSLLTGDLRLSEVSVGGPALDLGRPLPLLPEAEETDEISELPLAIDQIRVRGGSVVGNVPEQLIDQFESWELSAIDLDGTLDGDEFSVDQLWAVARLRPVGQEEVTFDVRGEAGGRIDMPLEIHRFDVSGDPLEFKASGQIGATENDIQLTFSLDADPGFLAGMPIGREISAQGEVDFGEKTGSLELQAEALPANLLAPFVEESLARDLELSDTTFTLDGDFHLKAAAAAGSVRAAGEKGERRLFDVVVEPTRLDIFSGDAMPFAAQITADLLPGESGDRRVVGNVVGDLSLPEEWQIEAGEIDLQMPDTNRFLTTVSRTWPQLLAGSALAEIPPLGRLSVSGDLSGALFDPEVDASADWRPHPGARATATLSGHPVGGEVVVSTEGADLDLVRFADGIAGRLEWSGGAKGELPDLTGGIHLAVWDVATVGDDGASETLFDVLDVRAEGDARQLAWAFDGTAPAIGDLEGRGTLVPAASIETFDGVIELTPLALPFDIVEAQLDLVDGALVVDAGVYRAGTQALTIDGRLPLDAVARLPGAEAVASLPLEGQDGLLDISWRLAEEEWTDVPPENGRHRISRLHFGSSGRLEIDTECVGCSRASGQLTGLIAEVDGRLIEAEGNPDLALADGELRVGPLSLSGEELTLTVDAFARLDTSWPLGAAIRGLVADSGVKVDGEIGSSWLDSLLPDAEDGGLLEVVTPGTATVRLRGGLRPQGLTGELEVSAPDLTVAAAALTGLPLSAPDIAVKVADGEAKIESLSCRFGEGTITGSGRLGLVDPMNDASGMLRISEAVPGLSLVELPFEIDRGVLSVDSGRVVNSGGEGTVRMSLPLTGEAAGPGPRVAAMSWRAPVADWGPLLRLLSGSEDPDELVFGSRGELAIDLAQPAASNARITLDEARVSVRGRETALGEMLVLTLEDGILSVPPTRLIFGEESFSFEARGEVARDWRLGDEAGDLLAGFQAKGEGRLDFGLMTPFLEGGRALGPLAVDLEVGGTLADFSGRVLLDGPDASILYRAPYLARLSEPRVDLVLSKGSVKVDAGTARLNNGPLTFGGTLLENGRSDLGISFEDSLFRVDYGLLATVGGDLRVEADLSDFSGRISGDIVVERGSLTRDVDLDFDLLTELLAPIDLSTTADDPLALIDLDLAVATREGVRVKNNLGDLLVRWEPIAVTGSLARPVLEGKVEVDPGGLLYAYGQTVRLDRAVIEYPGGELDEPRLDLEVTTSIEDPTIAQLAGDDPFRRQSDVAASGATTVDDVQQDLALYYGEQVASRLGESVGANISLRPLLIFGEADPGARLTISQDFSSHFSVAASIDLTNVENRTYLLEAHEFRGFPGFVGQSFTDDEAAYGGALLQRREFGGSRLLSESNLPRLGKIRLEKVPGISKRGLKRALGLTKGERFAPEDQFAAEVEVIDFLQFKGYPNATATVASTATGRKGRKIRLDLAVEHGPHVDFEFAGEKVPKALRRLIRSHYRTDFFEPESIETMRGEAIRALRSEGFVSPEVRIRVEALDSAVPDGDRLVTIEAEGGAQISPEAPIFDGVGVPEGEALRAAFFSAVQRVELAEGLAGADERLLRVMADLGYPQASIVNRYTSLADKRLTVKIEPGARRTALSVAIASDEPVDTRELEKLLAIEPGDPLRRDRLTVSALRMEQYLADNGYLAARVRTIVGDAGDDWTSPVTFRVERGAEHVVEAVEFTGLRSTRPAWVEKTAGIEPGEQLTRGDLPEARTTLWKTGLFSAVGTDTEDLGDGRQRVTFDLAERDRFRLAYGVRWDSEDGTSAVFDITDENFLGRQMTLGLRALWSDDDKSARWLTRVPRVGGGKGSLEFFALAEELVEFGIITETLQGTLQYSRPVGEKTTLRIYGRYSDTTLREEDPDPFFPLDERIKSPLIGWQYLYDSRGPEIFRERGLFLSVDLSGSEEFLGSDFRYARLFSQMNLYRGIGRLMGRPLSWAQSYRFGFARAFDQELLRSERFFAGGEYSVRGYDTESLGPTETLGSIVRPLGGESLLVVNQELHWRLFSDYSLLLFGDIGNVWGDSGDFGSDFVSSFGLGIRAATPVGLLRFDVARPTGRREGIDSEWALYFGLGATF